MKRTYLLAIALILLFSCGCYCSKFSFAVFGDKQGTDKVFTDLVAIMNQDSSIKFAMNDGDLTADGSRAEYEKYWNDKTISKVKIYDLIGNHDRGFMGRGVDIFRKKYGSTYSYFDYEGCRFIMMDNSSAKGLGSKQWAWLRSALKTKNKLFVFMHKPVFDPSGMYPSHIMGPQKEADQLEALLKKSGVKYAFAGHIHGYGREKEGNTVFIVAAGAGAGLYLPRSNGGFFHYVKVTVDGDNITDEVVKIYND